MNSEAVEQDGAAGIAADIRGFVRANMTALTTAELRDEDNIFEKGFVTSIFAMQLLVFIESTFDVTVPDDHITLRNFSSVELMTGMVAKLKAATG
ncbi:acyl carrier protein [Actinokineospora pegani]|uniref:acyl carrier protein n=1 Tax=Actinokineospora pegani TaxID=2654637 RepID=UPI0018D2BFBA|nr:acyl carrier protein [Actinokineospora pegani]